MSIEKPLSEDTVNDTVRTIDEFPLIKRIIDVVKSIPDKVRAQLDSAYDPSIDS